MSFEIKYNGRTGEASFRVSKHALSVIGSSLVISGFLSLSSPWWLGLITGVLNKVSIEIPNDYQGAISGLQIFIGFSLLAFKYLVLDKRDKQRNQDRQTWEKAELDIDKVAYFLNELGSDHSYRSSNDTEFQNSYTIFSKPQNLFQFKKTKLVYERYSDNALSLHKFNMLNFFVFPKGQISPNDYRYCLAPHFNEDRDGESSAYNTKEYSSLADELLSLQNETLKSFSEFIKHLKEVGHL